MSIDIKTHITDRTIKSVENDVKGTSKDIKNKFSKYDNDDIGNKAQAAVNKTVGLTAVSGAYPIKGAANVVSRYYNKENIKPAVKERKNLLNNIKNENANSKQNIKSEKKQYKHTKKDIKTDTSLSHIEKQKRLKDEKALMKSNIKTHRGNISHNKAQAKENMKSLRKLMRNESKIKTYGLAGAASVFAIIFIVIIAICASPFGILFTEDTGNSVSIATAISTINTEFGDAIRTEISTYNGYRNLYLTNEGSQYSLSHIQEIVSVWAVYYSESTNNEIIADITAAKLNELRNVRDDFVSITSSLVTETEIIEELDENGNLTITSVPYTDLYIDVDYKTIDEIESMYGLNAVQKEELRNLMADTDYLSLFVSLSGDNYSTINSVIVGSGQFAYPTTTTTISAGYPNYSNGAYHGGIDFPVPEGSAIYAADDGMVVMKRELNRSYGYYLIVDHGNGLQTLYAHNSRLLVNVGDTVAKGDIIAFSGSTGNSTGPHCHFEVRLNGNRVNPMNYLN